MKYITLAIVVVLACFGALAGSITPARAQAPGCTDVAGNPIDCPTEEVKEEVKEEDKKPTQTPVIIYYTSTPTATLTATPTATLPATATSLPLAAPTDETITADFWSGWCGNGDGKKDCMKAFAAQCIDAGGDISTHDDSVGSGSFLECTIGKNLTVRPTALSLSAAPTAAPTRNPDENYLGSCSKKDGDLSECFEKYKCPNGLLVIKVDLYTGSGTNYDFYCIPDGESPKKLLPIAIPADKGGTAGEWVGGCVLGDNYDFCMEDYKAICGNEGGIYSETHDDEGSNVSCEDTTESQTPGGGFPGGNQPWLGLAVGVIGGVLLLPAVQKVRDAAARMQGDDDGYKLKDVLVSSNTDAPGAETDLANPETPGGTEAAYIKFGDIKGE
ncbi:MAG TPA: hypothetical protein DCG54_03540 [Anaerolineae bacterium]|jgi:hypothetical protein|nr:hypothetical protein [Anaerolineae bacterium]